jgi:hypothetical protein
MFRVILIIDFRDGGAGSGAVLGANDNHVHRLVRREQRPNVRLPAPGAGQGSFAFWLRCRARQGPPGTLPSASVSPKTKIPSAIPEIYYENHSRPWLTQFFLTVGRGRLLHHLIASETMALPPSPI